MNERKVYERKVSARTNSSYSFLIIRIGFTMSLVLLLLALAWQPANAAPSDSLSGILTIIYGRGEDGETTVIYSLTSSTDEVTQLHFAPGSVDFETLFHLNGRQVQVTGTAMPDAAHNNQWQVLTVEQIIPADGAMLQDLSAPQLSGSYPFISLLCKFPDRTGTTNPLSYFVDQYSASYPGLSHYWDEASYGNFNLAGSTARDWKTLPQPRSYYHNVDGSLKHNLLAQHCTALFDSEVNFTQFAGINLMFNDIFEQNFAWGGTVTLCLDGKCSWRITWEPPWGWGKNTVMAHELGHSFGLPHSTGHGVTYKNAWDVMSDSYSNCNRATHAIYSCLPQHTIGYHKKLLGVFTPSRMATVMPGESATFTIERLTKPSNGNVQYVEVRIPNSSNKKFYTIEARTNTTASGYDYKLFGSAVILHKVDLDISKEPADVIDLDGNTNTNDAGAMWTPGEIFADEANNITISVLDQTASGFVVFVSNGVAPGTPAHSQPVNGAVVGQVAPTFRWGTVNGADRYTIEIKRVDNNATVIKQDFTASAICASGVCSLTSPVSLTSGVNYKWHVQALNGSIGSSWSGWWTFSILINDLSAVQLRSPGVDAVVYGGRPTFKWYPQTSASVYDVEMFNSAMTPGLWNKGVASCDPGPFCEHRLATDLASNFGDYYWRVRARNTTTGEIGDWSVTRKFTYTQLDRTWQISPTDGYPTTSTSPTLQWAPITGATMYLMQVRLSNDTLVFNTLVPHATFCNETVCTWNANPALTIGEYKWHVRAKNGRNFGRWTAYRTLVIE